MSDWSKWGLSQKLLKFLDENPGSLRRDIAQGLEIVSDPIVITDYLTRMRREGLVFNVIPSGRTALTRWYLNRTLRGVAWPIATNGDDSHPYIERDDDYPHIFPDDIAAAYAQAYAVEGLVIWHCVHNERGNWQPAVHKHKLLEEMGYS